MLCEKSEDKKNEVSCSKLLKYVMAESKFSKYQEHFSPYQHQFYLFLQASSQNVHTSEKLF